jgi:hypothetical protein
MKTVRALSERTMEVLEIGSRGWYRDHAGRSLTCGCSLVAPDKDCNLGTALYSLLTRPQEPVHHELCLREMLNPPHPRASAR